MAERFRVRAPELQGEGDWLNTGGEQLTLVGLRGKIVILDFWTFCCINCLHVLDELRELEEKYADVLVVVGVHSPKFAHEADPVALAAACERYEVAHPVINDPQLLTWQQYAVRAWPTLAVVDPEGYVVAQHSGEGHAHALDVLIAELVAEHEAKGTLQRGDSPYVAPPPQPTLLRFPAKAVRLDDRLLVADTGNHRVAEIDLAGERLLRAFGTGERGHRDGTAAKFNEPNGLCALPAEVAALAGYDLVVADTVNHLLRGISTATGEVTTIAGTGAQWMQGDGPNGGAASGGAPALGTPMSSPWDVAWWPATGQVVVAMAGIHQLWGFDPVARTVRVLAGTTNEGLLDGTADRAWLAQPSGLAVDGERVWFADSEVSALRYLTAAGTVHTAVGVGLFDFGYVDGPAAKARLQHPLGLAVLPDGSIAIADTYNGAVRRHDPVTAAVSTIAQSLLEPSGLLVDGAHLLAVEANAHRVTRLPLPEKLLHHSGEAMRTQRPAATLRSGRVSLRVAFAPPTGQKLDDRYGPSTQLTVSASPPELLRAGKGSAVELERELEFADPSESGVSEGVLHIAARAASCDDGEAEFPACHVHQQDWGVPVVLGPEGEAELRLLLAGLA